MTPGKLITIEGTEGAGKSTALQFVQDYFVKANQAIVITREPGGTEIAEEIRRVLLYSSKTEAMQPDTELLLMFASRAQHIQQCIVPALSAGTWVVSDRYVDASYAYQGGGRGIDLHKIQTLDQLVVGKVYPHLTLLLDIPVELGVLRTEKRGLPKDRIEQEKKEFFERVRQVYLERAKHDPGRIKIIDASLSLAEVQAQIRSVLDTFMAEKS
ncbi:MAG: dTMP kinase [Gammaproteobacteria bacterium]|nr:MAG: dTMP kinase [Gammaproteobacteria bacterium]